MDTLARASMRIPRDLCAVAEARAWVVSLLRDRHGVDPGGLETAAVLVSELVTNVLLHTASDPVVSISEGASRLVVGVADRSPERPVVRDLDPGRPGGNGMRIVAAWAVAWGVVTLPQQGKVVWFALPRPAAPHGEGSAC